MLFICFLEFTDPCRTQTLLESESCVLTLEKSIKLSMEQIVGYSRKVNKYDKSLAELTKRRGEKRTKLI